MWALTQHFPKHIPGKNAGLQTLGGKWELPALDVGWKILCLTEQEKEEESGKMLKEGR